MAKEETQRSWRLDDVGNKVLGSQRGKAEKGDRERKHTCDDPATGNFQTWLTWWMQAVRVTGQPPFPICLFSLILRDEAS